MFTFKSRMIVGDNMGTTKFDIKEVEALLNSLQESIGNYKESAETLNSSYEQYVNNDTFRGDGADAAKLYMNEIEVGIHVLYEF